MTATTKTLTITVYVNAEFLGGDATEDDVDRVASTLRERLIDTYPNAWINIRREASMQSVTVESVNGSDVDDVTADVDDMYTAVRSGS